MKLIVGLGNPGKKYEHTRHNIGFACIKELLSRLGCPRGKERFQAETYEVQIESEKVVLLLPLTYMNQSGRSVSSAVNFYGIDWHQELLVICDDFNLELGRIRFRAQGSSGGQKGLQNIIEQLGGSDFCRLRIGIGAPPENWEVTDYVLSRFRPDEIATMEIANKNAADGVLCWTRLGIIETMNQFNHK